MLIALMLPSVVAGQQEEKKQKPARIKPALLVIDIQNAYLPMMAERDRERGMMFINYAIQMFRLYGHPVIRVYNTDPSYGPPRDSREFEFPDSVLIKPDDPKIVKNYPSAFKKTDLEKVLREKGCNTVFLCGLSAVGCVLATYYGAQDLDFNTFMVKDALMSQNPAYTDMVEDITNAVGYQALEVMLANAEK